MATVGNVNGIIAYTTNSAKGSVAMGVLTETINVFRNPHHHRELLSLPLSLSLLSPSGRKGKNPENPKARNKEEDAEENTPHTKHLLVLIS